MEQANPKETAEIREKIWKGQLLVKFEVPEHYISGTDYPKPIYVSLVSKLTNRKWSPAIVTSNSKPSL